MLPSLRIWVVLDQYWVKFWVVCKYYLNLLIEILYAMHRDEENSFICIEIGAICSDKSRTNSLWKD